ncbi:MAG: hypothetical protein KDA68_15545, partial [Planctomycetaceae bacterium]|nr:hypothetical protein [Planctomycetaceae bacterium]
MAWRTLCCYAATVIITTAGSPALCRSVHAEDLKTNVVRKPKPGNAKPTGVEKMETTGKCPVLGNMQPASARHTAAGVMSNSEWWPDQLNL